MNIELPNTKERERSIRAVIDAAMPEKRTLIAEAGRLCRTVGIKNAFCGVGDAVAAALLVSFTAALTASIMSAASDTLQYFIPVLILSPVLYFSLLCFTSWKERMCGTWAVLASCRYNLKYITAIRVMLVSLAGMIFIPIVTAPFIGTAEYPKIVAAAFCAMFLYSTLTLLSLLVSESLLFQLVLPITWILFWGLLLIAFEPLQLEIFFAQLPLTVCLFAAFVMLCVYLPVLRVFVLRSTRRITAI